jgi:hypothetical protein
MPFRHARMLAAGSRTKPVSRIPPKYRWRCSGWGTLGGVVDLAELLHEISVAFAASSNLRTLLPRLATGMSLHLPVVEIEVVVLHRNGSVVDLAAYAPESGRRWTGQRSARFLQRQEIEGAHWCEELEPARVASALVESQLELAVGHAGILRLSFETDI